ncbi:processed acidic surface protein [Fictibacillus sp. KIGAM418]|uniref:Processed acidic surface protein n=1 Tax=Fictibacillus marinisediminis TaxID=2878389 RepID=A0A9X1XE08_9BACL|nr:processed acidic surface protein [Fictibacillus marinisediminis]MCK6259172.1 processed acidic surface protein [Fictibacillus marinisediminis]
MKKILLSLLAVLLAFYFMPANAFAAVKDTDLTAYLAQISKVRGYEISKEDYQNYLSDYAGMELSDFEDINELKETLGAVIKSDNSNLDELYTDFDLNEQQLKDLLAKNGEAIEDYIYVDDLYFAVSDLQAPDEEMPDFEEIQKEIEGALAEIDLTPNEIQNLQDHLMSIEKDLNSPDTEKRLESIAERMMSLDPEKPTKAQIQEVGTAFEELMSIFQMKANFFIVDGSKKTPVSAGELMQMRVLDGDYLLIQLFDLNGKMLADLKITSDVVKTVPAKVDTVTQTIKKEVKASAPVAKKTRTVTGGKLPKTASNHLDGALAGLAVAGAGLFLYRRARMS